MEIIFQMFKQIIIPNSVKNEVVDIGKQLGKADAFIIDKFIQREIILIEEPKNQQSRELPLGKGESDLIKLGMEEEDVNPLVCIDDIKAERIANKLGLQTCSSDILLLKALKEGIIDKLKFDTFLQKLSQKAGYSAIRILKIKQFAELLS